LQLHPSRYPNDSTQVSFRSSLLLGNAFFWFVPTILGKAFASFIRYGSI
jgi:hypothetical protein